MASQGKPLMECLQCTVCCCLFAIQVWSYFDLRPYFVNLCFFVFYLVHHYQLCFVGDSGFAFYKNQWTLETFYKHVCWLTIS